MTDEFERFFLYPGVCLVGLVKTTKTHRTAGVPPEIRTECLPNTSVESCLYTDAARCNVRSIAAADPLTEFCHERTHAPKQ
jgi:hypothetical protein